MKTIKEVRTLPGALEVRTTGGGGKQTIGGHIEYNAPSEMITDRWGDRFIEELSVGCFDKSLASREVVGLWSHDISLILGSTKNKTLRVNSDQKNLSFELDLPATQAGKDALELIKRGDVAGISFGMIVKDDKWGEVERDGQMIYKRTIIEADLFEISPVAFPAYPNTEVACRSLEEHIKNLEEELGMNVPEEKKQITKDIEGEKDMTETRTTIPAVTITANDTAKEQRAAFNHYLRTGEIRTMAISDDVKGAALAPVDFSKEIIDGLKDVAIMRQVARILPAISGKSAVYPRRTGGEGAAMVGEGEVITPYDLTFDQVTLIPKKAAAIVEVSNELLQDQAVDLTSYLAGHFIDEIGELLENQYLLGDATGANLQGILTAKANNEPIIKRVETAGATITVDDILTLWAALPAKYRKQAVFVCNSALEATLRGLKDGNGQYLMIQDLTTGLGNTLLGRPLLISEAFPNDLEAGADALMVGDFSKGVYIADKAGIDIQRNDAIGFTKDTVAFRAIFRTDIALAWPDALRVLAIKE